MPKQHNQVATVHGSEIKEDYSIRRNFTGDSEADAVRAVIGRKASAPRGTQLRGRCMPVSTAHNALATGSGLASLLPTLLI